MVGDEEKEEKQEIELGPVEKSVRRFAYAISEIKKDKSETFDLMAEKAIEFYLSKESKDISGQIIHAIEALFYFVAFAITNARLTNKLVTSLEVLSDPKHPNAVKEFAVQVMKDKDVWDQIVNNETLKPYLIKLGKEVIKGAGLPFPSYKEMERKYIKEQKAAGHPNPRYIPSLYIRALMRMEIEGFEKEPKIGTPEYKAKREYITGILRDRAAYAEILDDKKLLDTVLSTAQAIVTNEGVNNAILSYVNAPETVPLYKEMERKYIEEQKNAGNPNPVYTPILYIEALIGMGIEGFEKEPKIGAPEYKEKLEYITEILRDRAAHEEALDDKKVLEAALKIAQDTVTNEAAHANAPKKVVKASIILSNELVAFVKTGALDALLVQLTNHPTLMPYVVNVVNGYINAMDMSKPGGDNTAMVVSLLGHATLWDQVISNTALRPHIVSIAETYLNKVANMSFDERKAGYDRAHKDDKPAAPAYTQGMYDQDKAAAMSSASMYLSLLRDDATVNAVVSVGKFVLTRHNQDILGYLSAPKKEGELLPSGLIPVIKALIDGDKLEPLLGKLEVIFRTLAPDNFAPNAPEFGVGIMDKSLLNLIFNLLDPSKKAEFYKLLSTVVGELNKILAEFSKKVIVDGVEQNVPFFAALGGIVDVVSKNTVLKDLIEGSPDTISKIIHYVVRKNFNQYCIQYGIQDKFWGVFDIAFKDLSAVRSLLVGLQEITNGGNYKNKDGSFNGQGTEKAVDTFIRELVKFLNHPVIGKPLRDFVRDNKGVFISLIDGILNNIPAAKPYITDYVLGLGLTFSDVLDQLVHDPNDVIKLLDMAVDIGALRGGVSREGVAAALKNKWTKGEGLGVYSPVVQQVIAEAAKPYIPQVVVDWTPQWFKNYVPGGTAAGDRRGAGFGKWVWININTTPKELNTNLHDVLVEKSKADKAVTDEAREFINYNALAKLNFGDEALMLNRYLVEGFSFSGSQASEVYMTKSEVKKSNFKGFGAKEFFINNSKVDEVKFDGAKLDKLVFKEGAVVSNTSFKDVRVRELIISDSELTNVDFTGLKFEMEVSGWLYGKSVVANPNAILTIRNSTIDKASLANLEAAAKAGGFKLELDDRVKIVEQPAKKEPVVVVPEGEKLLEKCSKECADKIIAHLKTVEFIDFGLSEVKDQDLREFLRGVMQHAFSNMPQENLMYFSQMDMNGLYSVLQNDDIIKSLENVYEVNDGEIDVDKGFEIKFKEEVMGVIETFCSKERVLIEERDKIAPKSPIKPKEERRKEVGSGTRNL